MAHPNANHHHLSIKQAPITALAVVIFVIVVVHILISLSSDLVTRERGGNEDKNDHKDKNVADTRLVVADMSRIAKVTAFRHHLYRRCCEASVGTHQNQVRNTLSMANLTLISFGILPIPSICSTVFLS